MNPSVIREILKVTEKPGIISLAGGRPRPSRYRPLPKPAAVRAGQRRPRRPAVRRQRGLCALRRAIADFLPWDVV